MKKSLRIVITGGASGLGKLLSESLIKEGHQVWAWGRKAESEIETSLKEGLKGYKQVDLADEFAVKKAFDQQLVAGGIDVLINNASLRTFRSFQEFDDGLIKDYIQVNQLSPMLLSKWAIPEMQQQSFGRIIHIASGSGLKGYSGGSMYCSTKSAIISFTEAAGRDLAADAGDITMNAIVPGAFSKNDGTELVQYKRVTNEITRLCHEFIHTPVSGRTVLVMDRKEKFQYLLGTIKKFISRK